MSDIININTLDTSKELSFKNPRLIEATNEIRKIYTDAAAYAEEKNREIAKVLGRIKAGKLYEADGFKNVYDYADKVFGIKKANAYVLAQAGEVYNDTKAPASLKSFTPSKLAAIASVDRDKVTKAIEEGKISKDTTQKDLRDFSISMADSKKINKSKVVDTYTAKFFGSAAHIPSEFLTDNYTLEYWDHAMEQHLPDVEIVKLPKGKVSPDAEKATVTRRLYISGAVVIMVEFRLWKPAPAPTPKKDKRIIDLESMSLDDLEKLLASKRAAMNLDKVDTKADTKEDSESSYPQQLIEKVNNAASASKTDKADKPDKKGDKSSK